MIHKFKKETSHIWIYYAFLIVCVFFIVVVACRQSGSGMDMLLTGKSVYVCDTGWKDAKGQELELPVRSQVKAGEVFQLSRTLGTQLPENAHLLFYTEHSFVKAYLNGKQIYQFGDETEILFGKTPGSAWQVIPLVDAKPGDILQIETMCPYDKYAGTFKSPKIGTKSEIVSYIMWKGIIPTLAVLFMILTGGALLILPAIFFRQLPYSKFFNVGFAMLILSVWSFTEAGTWQLYFGDAYLMQMISFVTFSLYLPATLMALQNLGYIKKNRRFYRWISIDLLVALLLLLAQVFEVKDYFETLPVTHAMMAVNAFIFISAYFKQADKEKRYTVRGLGYVFYLILIVCASLDLMDFYVWNYFGNGFFSRIELFALLICTGVAAMKRTFTMHKQYIEKMAYERMAYTDFLTNLLNKRSFERELKQTEVDRNPISVMYIDMNGLKHINDSLGHARGDDGLKLVASKLIEHFSSGKIYRIGGDEFSVLIEDTDIDSLKAECQVINKEMEAFHEEYAFPIGISYGVARYNPIAEEPIGQVVKKADQAMYCFKSELYARLGIQRG